MDNLIHLLFDISIAINDNNILKVAYKITSYSYIETIIKSGISDYFKDQTIDVDIFFNRNFYHKFHPLKVRDTCYKKIYKLIHNDIDQKIEIDFNISDFDLALRCFGYSLIISIINQNLELKSFQDLKECYKQNNNTIFTYENIILKLILPKMIKSKTIRSKIKKLGKIDNYFISCLIKLETYLLSYMKKNKENTELNHLLAFSYIRLSKIFHLFSTASAKMLKINIDHSLKSSSYTIDKIKITKKRYFSGYVLSRTNNKKQFDIRDHLILVTRIKDCLHSTNLYMSYTKHSNYKSLISKFNCFIEDKYKEETIEFCKNKNNISLFLDKNFGYVTIKHVSIFLIFIFFILIIFTLRLHIIKMYHHIRCREINKQLRLLH